MKWSAGRHRPLDRPWGVWWQVPQLNGKTDSADIHCWTETFSQQASKTIQKKSDACSPEQDRPAVCSVQVVGLCGGRAAFCL